MRIVLILTCIAAIAGATRASAETASSDPIPIAVFGFELEDISPAGSLGQHTTSEVSLQKTTEAARDQLKSSGRYAIVSIDDAEAKSPDGKALRDCDGCETPIAKKHGAQQSMIGIVRRVTQTDYYIVVVIRDVETGKIVNAQVANFAGGEGGWASGVRTLLRHQVLR